MVSGAFGLLGQIFGLTGGTNQQLKRQENEELNQRALSARSTTTLPSQRQNFPGYQEYVPCIVGQVKIYPHKYQPSEITSVEFYNSNKNFRINMKHFLVIGEGNYEPITAADIDVDGVPGTELGLTISQKPSSVDHNNFFTHVSTDDLPIIDSNGLTTRTDWIEVARLPTLLQERGIQSADAPSIQLNYHIDFPGGVYVVRNGIADGFPDEYRPQITVEIRIRNTAGAVIHTWTDTMHFNSKHIGNVVFIGTGSSQALPADASIKSIECRIANITPQSTAASIRTALNYPNTDAYLISNRTCRLRGVRVNTANFFSPPAKNISNITLLNITQTIDSKAPPSPNSGGRIKITTKRRLPYFNDTSWEERFTDNVYAITEGLLRLWNTETGTTPIAYNSNQLRSLRDTKVDTTFNDIVPAGNSPEETITNIFNSTTSAVVNLEDGLAFLEDDSSATPSRFITRHLLRGELAVVVPEQEYDGVEVDYIDEDSNLNTILADEFNTIYYDAVASEWRIDGDEPDKLNNPIASKTQSLFGRQRGLNRAWELHRRWTYRQTHLGFSAPAVLDYTPNEEVTVLLSAQEKQGVVDFMEESVSGTLIKTQFSITDDLPITLGVGQFGDRILRIQPANITLGSAGGLFLLGGTIANGVVNWNGNNIYPMAQIAQTNIANFIDYKISSVKNKGETNEMTAYIDTPNIYDRDIEYLTLGDGLDALNNSIIAINNCYASADYSATLIIN